jgi:hypothetical protein
MTLILTVANVRGVHQSSDYMLTTRDGKFVCNEAGSKQLQASLRGMHLQVAFTGVTNLNRPTIIWLAAELKALPISSTLQQVVGALSHRCNKEMKPFGPGGVLTVVLAASRVGKPLFVVEISNTDWKHKGKTNAVCARKTFYTAFHEVKKPFYLISGWRDRVQIHEERRLKALARSDRPADQIRRELVSINETAAQRSNGCISSQCWVSSQFADGADTIRSQMQNAGQQGGSVRTVMGGTDLDILDFVMKNFPVQAVPGQTPRIVQSASASFVRRPDK